MKCDTNPSFLRAATSASVLLVALAAGGCAQIAAVTQAPAPTAATPAAAAPMRVAPGMNAQGEVVDSKLVEAGHGQKVKGVGDWNGEITGRPAANSKFNKLQIGMSAKQVTDLAGEPSDQGRYLTGKAFIPWYFGSDKYRHEMVYKGTGRLIFASPAGFDFSTSNLVWIIHNANEGGYR